MLSVNSLPNIRHIAVILQLRLRSIYIIIQPQEIQLIIQMFKDQFITENFVTLHKICKSNVKICSLLIF